MTVHPKMIGPYAILEILDRAGSDTVFLGRRYDTGEHAAVTIVELVNNASLASIRREIRTVARANHPRVVSIVDEGVENGMPWFAMTLPDGLALREYAASARIEPDESLARDRVARVTAPLVDPRHQRPRRIEDLPPSEHLTPRYVRFVIDLARRLCAPLEWLHGEGFVHGFLSPDCIRIREGGDPVLRNFGFGTRAEARDANRFDVALFDASSVAYVAPERVRGERCDVRSDLYSLGCIVYELLASRPPFTGSATRLARPHADLRPIALGRFVGGVPSSVEEIVLRLLSRSASERFPSARELARALDEVGAKEADNVALPQARRVVLEPPFVGRDDVLALFESQFASIEEGRGALVVLKGPTGSGKTRLLAKACDLARERGFFVAPGSAIPSLASIDAESLRSVPLAALRGPLGVVAEHCRNRGAYEANRVLAHRALVLKQLEPAIGRLAGVSDAEAVELSIDAARSRTITQTIATFVALADETPVLLALDDLEWADDLTSSLLEYLISGNVLADHPLLVVATVESGRTPSVDDWTNAPRVVPVELGRLEEATLRAIVKDIHPNRLSPDPPYGSDAVALQAVHHAYSEALDSEGECRSTVPESSNLGSILASRLDALPSPAMSVAAALAVVGRGASTSLLAEVSGLSELAVIDATAELIRRRIVHEPELDQHAFSHPSFAEIMYSRLPAQERAQLHASAATALERIDDAPRYPIARHWEQSSSRSAASSAYLAAARSARSLGAIELATRAYRRYLELGEANTEEFAAARLEFVSNVLGRNALDDDVLAEFVRALDCARAAGGGKLEARGLRMLATAHKDRGEIARARELLTSALANARAKVDRSDEAAALRGLAMVDAAAGLLERSRAQYEQALSLVIALGDTREEASLRSALAVVCAEGGDLRTALDMFDSGYTLARAAGDLRVEANILANLAILYQHGGHLDQARQAFEGALANLRIMGNRRHEGITLSHLAALYEAAGRDLKALSLYEASLVIHREVSNTRAAGVALQRVSVIEGRLGDVATAREHFATALTLLESAGSTRDLAVALLEAAPLERRMGDLATAATMLARARELAERAGDPSIVASCLCEHGHQLVARGQSPDAVIDQVLSLARTLGAGVDSDLGRAIAKLQRSVAALETGEIVLVGEYVEDLPKGIRRLIEGADPIQPSV